MKYELVFAKSAEKEYDKLRPPHLKLVTKKLDELETNPRPAGCLKLKGFDGETWRVRAGDYRILYTIEDVLRIVDIRKIRHRSDAY